MTQDSTGTSITFDRATKIYPGAASPALDELNLEVEAGELVCLVGPSGGGKTTALQLVNRLVDLSSGDIRIGGRSITDQSAIELRGPSGMRSNSPASSRTTRLPTTSPQSLSSSAGTKSGLGPARLNCLSSWASAQSKPGCRVTRLSSQVVSSSVWASPARWRRTHRSCSW